MTSNQEFADLLARVALRDRVAFEQAYRATCAHLLGIAFLVSTDKTSIPMPVQLN